MSNSEATPHVGHPTDYRPEYCEMLIGHMANGSSFESFAGVVSCAKRTLYNWAEAFPEFLQAKSIGEGKSLQFLERIGLLIATAQNKRVKWEKPILDSEGKPLIGPDGKVLYEREYEYVAGNPTAWIFMMKNMHGWRDRKEFALSDPNSEKGFREISHDEIQERLLKLGEKMMSRALPPKVVNGPTETQPK